MAGRCSTSVPAGQAGELTTGFNAMKQELELQSNMLLATFEQAAVGLACVSPEGRCLQANQKLCDILGYAREALLERDFRDVVYPEDIGSDRELERRLLAAEIGTYSTEKRLLRRDGDRIWVNITMSLVRKEGGAPDYFLLVVEDIARRKNSEALLAAQNQVLEMIAGGAQLTDTLTKLMRVIEAQCDEILCSVLLLDKDGMHLRHGAAPSLPPEYMDAIDGGAIGAQVGSCGTAAYRRQAVFVENIAIDPLWAAYRELALRHDLHACWSTPIFDAGRRLLGTFAVYYRTPCMPSERHLELIEVATHTAAIAISHQQGEQALRAERALLEQVTACSPVGIIAADMNAQISLINQAALQMLDVDREEVMRRTFRSPEWQIADVHGNPVPPQELPFARVKLTGKPVFDSEYSIQRRDGRRVQLSVNAAALPDEAGQMQGIVFAVSDITERNKVLETLRTSEEKFAIAFRSSPDAIFISSRAEGRIIDINEAGLRLTGYRRDEMIGHTTQELRLWANAGDRERYVAQMTGGGKVIDMETELRNKAGEIRTAIVSGELIGLEDLPCILAVVRDITEQKRAAAEILQLNTELEQRVIERTAQLEAANRELEAFCYSVSHDLKAPLRGIDGYSQLLEEIAAERLDEDGRLFLRNIRQGTAQMQALITDLLSYARMERRTLEDAVLDLPVCVDAIMQGYLHDIVERGAVLRKEVPALSVRGDREELATVLSNLLDNALKFSRDARPPTIEIGAREEGGKVILWVRDNGIGFDMKFHERIFDIFSRLQRAEDYAGTGVGLALVRKAMQRMKGRVWAESTPGQGATFFLEFRHG
jgi:PAS domain S-box-containing protein